VPPPETAGHELWHSESEVQDPQVPPLLLPLDVLPLPLEVLPPLLVLPLPLPPELLLELLELESYSYPLSPPPEEEDDDVEEVELPPSVSKLNPPFEESPCPQAVTIPMANSPTTSDRSGETFMNVLPQSASAPPRLR
jgi:hypothetical protein